MCKWLKPSLLFHCVLTYLAMTMKACEQWLHILITWESPL